MELLAYSLVLVWAWLSLQTVLNIILFPGLAATSSRGPWPSVSVVVPARDEERSIGACVDAALRSDYPHFEVIVVNDRSSDNTAQELLQRAHDPRLKIIDSPEPPAGWLGKPHALSQGTRQASSDWLLFMDADVVLSPECLRAAIACTQRERLDHLSLFPDLERKGFWEELLMPSLATAFFVLAPSFVSLLPRTRLAFGGGAFNLVRASAYFDIGGHQLLKRSIIDDMRLAIELKKAGYRCRIRMGRRWLRLRMYHGRREIAAGFTKNAHVFMMDRPVRGAMGLVLLALAELVPFGWPLWWVASLFGGPAPPLTLAVALALSLGSRTAVHWRMGYRLWPVLLTPVSLWMGFIIIARSLVMAYGQGVIQWRGRSYPRGETEF